MSLDLADVGRRDLEDIQQLVKKLEFLGPWWLRLDEILYHLDGMLTI
jgi:hypothetical protein